MKFPRLRRSAPFLFVLSALAGVSPGSAADESIAPPAPKAEAAIWAPGIRCAVSLSYDDAVPVHHLKVAPLLEQHGLRGTFYLAAKSIESPDAWKAVAARGHELGNHSLFHPCRRNDGPGYSWLPEYYDLRAYTPERFRDELTVANLVLDLLDGGRPRTYGNNCTNLTIGTGANEVPMDPILDKLFVAARGAITNRPVDPRQPEFTRLGHFSGDRKTFVEMRAEIEEAGRTGGWVIYMIHGVGQGTHSLFIDEAEHRQLIEWLDQSRDTIWTAPVVEVAAKLRKR